ncbi:uncharacterized protein LOC143346848 [Colletes latitarsis]|uniref:uncharacterized protein LOC143346848 n=1 Tax=Colletes latitarsis TaxID=2605962 RepID=UPI0040367174
MRILKIRKKKNHRQRGGIIYRIQNSGSKKLKTRYSKKIQGMLERWVTMNRGSIKEQELGISDRNLFNIEEEDYNLNDNVDFMRSESRKDRKGRPIPFLKRNLKRRKKLGKEKAKKIGPQQTEVVT